MRLICKMLAVSNVRANIIKYFEDYFIANESVKLNDGIGFEASPNVTNRYNLI